MTSRALWSEVGYRVDVRRRHLQKLLGVMGQTFGFVVARVFTTNVSGEGIHLPIFPVGMDLPHRAVHLLQFP